MNLARTLLAVLARRRKSPNDLGSIGAQITVTRSGTRVNVVQLGRLIFNTAKHSIAAVMNRHFPRAWLAIRIARHDRHFESEFWLVPLFCDKNHIAIDIGA